MSLQKKESIQERQISVDPISLTCGEMQLNVKLVSCSLPTSPRLFEMRSARQKKYKNQQSLLLSRQQSVAIGNLERLRMQRSKSCGEGRASQPSMDFDLWPSAANHTEAEVKQQEQVKTRERGRGGRGGGQEHGDKFKCGACLFLPGLGSSKGKSVRKEAEEEDADARIIVSQRASLEKFECGSWRSSAIISYQDDDDVTATSNLFFDLPLELMRCGSSANDTESPVTTGFVFDSKDHNRKGVLKVMKSHESCNSSRHVRFSTSSPTSPRLRKARNDFSAFLEAQSA